MNYEEIKKQLLSRIDEIAKAIMVDKIVEIKKERDNIQIFEVQKRKFKK